MAYLKKEFFDTVEGIDDVLIHYTVGPLGLAPDWTRTESRSMPAGVTLKTGVGEVAKYGPLAPRVPQVVHPRLRKKVLNLPEDIWDPRLNTWTGDFQLQYFYEISRGGQRSFTPVLTDEIRTRTVVFLDPLGLTGGACVNWSVYDWDAPQFSPTEDVEFLARFGEDHPLRSIKFYGSAAGTALQDPFAIAKKAVIDTLPLPHLFSARIAAPAGATVRLRLHTGNTALPEAQRWEDYWLDESFVMQASLPPLVLTPLGTQAAPRAIAPVTPDLLVGNPYLPLVMQAQMVAAVRAAEAGFAAAPRPLVGVR